MQDEQTNQQNDQQPQDPAAVNPVVPDTGAVDTGSASDPTLPQNGGALAPDAEQLVPEASPTTVLPAEPVDATTEPQVTPEAPKSPPEAPVSDSAVGEASDQATNQAL